MKKHTVKIGILAGLIVFASAPAQARGYGYRSCSYDRTSDRINAVANLTSAVLDVFRPAETVIVTQPAVVPQPVVYSTPAPVVVQQPVVTVPVVYPVAAPTVVVAPRPVYRRPAYHRPVYRSVPPPPPRPHHGAQHYRGGRPGGRR